MRVRERKERERERDRQTDRQRGRETETERRGTKSRTLEKKMSMESLITEESMKVFFKNTL